MNYHCLRVKQIQMRKTYMKITASDISEKQFMEKPEGLDAEEVYAFLEIIKEDMYELDKENAILKSITHAQSTQIKLIEAILSVTIENLKKIDNDIPSTR